MAGMDHSAAGHGEHGAAPAPGDPHAGHRMPADTAAAHAGMPHGEGEGAQEEHPHDMHQLHARMLRDPVIRERVMADTAMHRLMMEMVEGMPAEQREEMMRAMHPPADPAHDAHPAPAARKPAPAGRAAPARKPAPKPAAKRAPADPHAGHGARPTPRPADPHAGHGKPPARKPAPKPDTTRSGHHRHPGGH